MHTNNNAALVKRQLLVRMVRLLLEDRLVEAIDDIPFEVTEGGYQPVRCCVHHDRAILRTRLLAALGLAVEGTDETRPLAEYAREALARRAISGPVLTVLDDACHACVRTQFLVTNACQGCLARPCKLNCPKGAIRMAAGHACIDTERCVNCGICLQVCPYHAIIKVPVPCEEACPVQAITKTEDGKERIDTARCIHCGACMRECPFGALMDRSQLVDVVRQLKVGRPAVALYAPAIAGQFRGSRGQLHAALLRAGFAAAVEVARGADLVAVREAEELGERLAAGEPFMTTSCCPAWGEAVRLHLPAMAARVSRTPTPMHVAAELAAAEHPGMLRVFIGPCLAKRKEALGDALVDHVLSAEELGALFVAHGIEVDGCPDEPLAVSASPGGRGFPIPGGVASAVQSHVAPGLACRPQLVQGLDRKMLRSLAGYAGGAAPEGNLLEVMACAGGCIAGPSVVTHPRVATAQLKKAT